jgi:hypothetical protein
LPIFVLLLVVLLLLRLLLHDDTTETRRTFFNDALLLLLVVVVFLLRDFKSGDVTLCVRVYNVCVCVWLKNDDSDEKQGGGG